MQKTLENLALLKSKLKKGEKMDVNIVDGEITSAVAYVDDYIRKPGDFSRGNYFRWLYTSGSISAAIG